MSDVKQSPRIPYRQRQAMETKRRLAQSARRLFAEHGYGSTSVEAIAADVGVAVRTVYAAFGSKKAILGAVCEEWLAEAEVFPLIAQATNEPDPRRAVALLARLSRRQWEQGADVIEILRSASTADGDVARMLKSWKRSRAEALAAVVEARRDALAPGVSVATACAVVAGLSAAEVYQELVEEAGWSADRYERWLAGLLAGQLLGAPFEG